MPHDRGVGLGATELLRGESSPPRSRPHQPTDGTVDWLWPAAVPERDETNNCRASSTPLQVGRPDLVIASVSGPSPAVRGTSIQVSATVKNKTSFNATATFRVQYYLSLDWLKNGGDRLLTGYRTVAGLAAGMSSPATTSVTIPAATPTGDYFLLVCADDTFLVMERNETNNCRASAAKLKVTP